MSSTRHSFSFLKFSPFGTARDTPLPWLNSSLAPWSRLILRMTKKTGTSTMPDDSNIYPLTLPLAGTPYRPKFGWRALRLLGKTRLHYFQDFSAQEHLPDFLAAALRRLGAEIQATSERLEPMT